MLEKWVERVFVPYPGRKKKGKRASDAGTRMEEHQFFQNRYPFFLLYFFEWESPILCIFFAPLRAHHSLPAYENEQRGIKESG